MPLVKNYTILVLFIIIGLLLTGNIYQKCKYDKLSVATVEVPKIAPVLQKIDKNGNSYVETKEVQFTQAQVNKLADSLKKVYRVTKVQQVVTEYLRIDTISKPEYIVVDTLNKTLYVVDSNRYLRNAFSGSLQTHTGTFSLQLTTDTLTGIETFKRHLFKANETNILFTHSNKYISTDSASAYTVKETTSKWVFGPTIGVQCDLTTNQIRPYIGFGVMFNVYSIKR